MAIVRDTLVHDSPEPLDRVQMRAVWWKLDQMDAAVWPCEESPDIWSFVVGGVVPDDMDDALVRIARLDPGEELCGTDPIDGRGFDKGRVEGFKVKRTMDVDPSAPCGGLDRGA